MSAHEQQDIRRISPEEFKPRFGSFIFPRIVTGLVLSVVLAAVAAGALMSADESPWPGLAVLGAGGLLTFASSLVAYRKERYRILGSRVICHGGGLLSDRTTELEIRKITHVKIKLPWLRHRLFGVGDVLVQTAGHAQPVTLRVIREPEAVYAILWERMRMNGYDLTQGEVLHEEKPAVIGIAGEMLGAIIGLVFASLALLPAMNEARQVLGGRESPDFLLPALSALVFLLFGAFVTLRFLDLRRRTYRVFNDVVIYAEGFLTRETAFIPYENIADARTDRSFLARIFGLHDVRISCQGSGSEIAFRHLRRGVALSASIDRLVGLARRKREPAPRSAAPVQADRPRRAEPDFRRPAETMHAELRMDPMRTLAPMLFLLPLIPVWIAAMTLSVIRLVSTRYSVRSGSVRHSYRFLTVRERQFAYEKITGVVIRRNLWDRLFGTLTVRFWSIGSGQPLEFAHVNGRRLDLVTLMRQAGIPAPSPTPHEVTAAFNFPKWLRARLKILPLVPIFAAAAIYAGVEVDPLFHLLLLAPLILAIIDLIHGKLYYVRQRLRFHEHHVEAEQGILARYQFHSRYGNVKRTKATRYPGGRAGELEIFVAGEEEVRQAADSNGGRRRTLKPCSFTSGFLPDAGATARLLDDILCGRVAPSPEAVAAGAPEALLEARRSPANALAMLTLLSVVAFPLLVLLPITFPLTMARVSRWRYCIEPHRIVARRGIFYRCETSILLDRVDSLQQHQGPLNKLFGNGNVSIMTAGSSAPDLMIVESPAHAEIHRIIRERLQ